MFNSVPWNRYAVQKPMIYGTILRPAAFQARKPIHDSCNEINADGSGNTVNGTGRHPLICAEFVPPPSVLVPHGHRHSHATSSPICVNAGEAAVTLTNLQEAQRQAKDREIGLLRTALFAPLSSAELRLVDKHCDWVAFKCAWDAVMKMRRNTIAASCGEQPRPTTEGGRRQRLCGRSTPAP